ncbi:MAG: DUF302 domain-containing protein [Candidatus Cloacimonetes bacterium]|nr:DUF302 domain-containing protein [Candidatus Cloacimonadota bacterium]
MKTFISGFLVGAVVVAVAIWFIMPGLMLNVLPSKYDFPTTMEKIEDEIYNQGWDIQRVYDMQECLNNNDFPGMTPIQILSICKPSHANEILQDDRNKKVTAIMPCRIGVYEDSNGQVWISSMNMGLLGKMFGGVIKEVISHSAVEEKKILAPVLQEK